MKDMKAICSCPMHRKPMECTVKKCTNNEDQGNGLYLHVVDKEFGFMDVEWVCMPCWDAFRGYLDNPQSSQVFKNMKNHFFSHSHHDVDEYYKDDYEGD